MTDGPNPSPAGESCPRCRARLPVGAPHGLCPQCVLQGALDLLEGSRDESDDRFTGGESASASSAPCRQFGDYELLEEIARGGMGVVFRARQRSVDRIVAVKMLLSAEFAGRELIQRFRTEAAAAASLKHPNIVAIHEVGFHAGQHYFAMDFVAGNTLAEAVRSGPLPPRRAALILQTVAEAVHYAHEHGILHRDLKPSNIILDADDRPYITDFGLAKRLSENTEVTLSAQTLGSPNYMPPEQAATDRGKVSRRSDVYALGAILYHGLTGRPPFVGGTLAETLQALLNTEPVPPRLLQPTIPADLATIAVKCLEKDPARRYATAREVADDLGRWSSDVPILARPAGHLEKSWRWCRRNPALAASLGGILLLLVFIAVGSTAAAWRLKRQEAALQQSLRAAYLSEAHLRRQSGEIGQRLHALEDLTRATAIRPSIELRNEAIAALALPDLRALAPVACPPGHALSFDARATTYVDYPVQDETTREAIVRRVADGIEIGRVPMPEGAGSVQLSPDGRFLILHRTAPDGATSMLAWDLGARAVAIETDVPNRGWSVDFHLDGRLAAFGQSSNSIVVADLPGRQTVKSFPTGFPVHKLRFHPDGSRIAAARLGATEVVVFDGSAGVRVAGVSIPGWVSGALDWSPDGRWLAVGCLESEGGHVIRLIEWQTNDLARSARVLRGHEAPVVDARFLTGTDFLLSSAYEPSSRLWSLTTGRQLLICPFAPAFAAADGTELALHTGAAEYRRHRLTVGTEYRLLAGHWRTEGPTTVSFSPRAPLAASASLGGVRLWHLPAGQELGVLPVGVARGALFHPMDGSLFVLADSRITRWPIETAAGGETILVGPPEVFRDGVAGEERGHLAFSGDGSWLGVSVGERAEVLTVGPVRESRTLPHGAPVSRIDLSQDGAWAVTCGEGRFRIWELSAGRLVREHLGGGYSGVAFSPDGRWVVLSFSVSGGGEGLHRLCRVGTWDADRDFAASHTIWNAASFSPDSRLLALRVSSSAVRLLDTRDWSEVATLDVPGQQQLFDLSFSPDGTRLGIACETGLVQCWDLRELRRSLAALGLDWDLPSLPAASRHSESVPRWVVRSNEATKR